MCLSDRVVFVRQDEERGHIYYKTILGDNHSLKGGQSDHSTIEAQTAAWLQDYLNLSVPLESLYVEWSEKDPVFARFAKRFSGLPQPVPQKPQIKTAACNVRATGNQTNSAYLP